MVTIAHRKMVSLTLVLQQVETVEDTFDFDGSQDKIVGPDCSTIFDDVSSGSGGDATIEVWVVV